MTIHDYIREEHRCPWCGSEGYTLYEKEVEQRTKYKPYFKCNACERTAYLAENMAVLHCPFAEGEIDANTATDPNHYKIHAMECWDEMEVVFGKEAVITFCKLNAWKYRYRASAKNGEQDLKKADVYLQKAKELENSINKGEY